MRMFFGRHTCQKLNVSYNAASMSPRTTKHLFLSGITSIMLASCTGAPGEQSSALQEYMKNPLFLERYAEEIVESLVQMQIEENPLLADEKKAALVDKARTYWLAKAKQARREQAEGRQGTFLLMEEFAQGDTLLSPDGRLYIGPTFEVTPSPDLHVFISTVVDPRDQEFPDPSSIDVGSIATPYGAQAFVLPDEMEIEQLLLYRTVVLWDTGLERLMSFAQLH